MEIQRLTRNNETMFDDKVAQYIAVTMIGGAVSEAAGGDFLDGAISAAMVHLFNDLSDPQKIQRHKELSQARNEWERFQVTVKWDMIAGNQDMIKVGKGAMNIYNGLSYALPKMWNNAPPAAKGVLITAGGIVALPVIIPAAEYGVNYVYMNPLTTMTGIGIADNLFLGGTPFSTYKEGIATYLHDYNPWAVK